MNDVLFNFTYAASHKYDGTNVGKDESGVKYGRNQTIPPGTKSYQKTTLEFVEKLDAAAVKADLIAATGIAEGSIECFNLYGELMCNKGLYNYSQDKLDGTHQVFGAVIRPANKAALKEIAEKLGAAKFACKIKGGEEEEEGPQEEDKEGEDDGVCNEKVNMYMNEGFKALLEKQNVPMVPLAGTYASFYELYQANYDWMVNGNGEGLVLISPADGPNSDVSKWKIGAETSGDNFTTLNNCLNVIEDDKENKIFGENKEKAKELFTKMLEVESSKLINGEIPKPKGKAPKEEKKKQAKGGIVLTDEETKAYEVAITSAKTKYDHGDTYYAKGGKGLEEYSQLIAKECLNDITVDAADKQASTKHINYIKQVLKEEFIAFNRAKAKK